MNEEEVVYYGKENQVGEFTFEGAIPIPTQNFITCFGGDWIFVEYAALIKMKLCNAKADYIQKFECNGKVFYAIGDSEELKLSGRLDCYFVMEEEFNESWGKDIIEEA